MGSEYMGPLSDPDKQQAAPNMQPAHPSSGQEVYEEPSYREHVTRPLQAPSYQATPYPPMTQPQQPYQQGAPNQSQQQPYQQQPYQPQGQQPYSPQMGQPYYPQQGQQPYYPAQGQQQPYSANGYPAQQQPFYGGGYPAYPQQWNGNSYQPVPQQQNYYPYAQGYPGYYYGYPPQYYYGTPAQRKRDGYLFVISILAVIGSSLAVLGGLGSVIVLLLISVSQSSQLSDQSGQLFSGLVLFVALAVAGCLGGGFGLYHSIRSLLRKSSSEFKLPQWWIFLASYVVVIIIAAILRANGLAVANLPLSVFLIALAGLLPALTILSLGDRRLHFPQTARWPTRWRRFAVAIASGATLAIVLALLFETILQSVASNLLQTSSGFSLDNPNQPIPSDPRAIGLLFVLVSVIAPLVEETVKPLAVVALIGRVESAAEAFILGLSCGIGFDLIETSGYISSGYQNWLDVALQRSTAGLLHGLGAAMVSLGWYYLTHPKASHHRFIFGFGCMLYAVLQHAIWNGSFLLQLLPAPIGPYLADGTIGGGAFAFPAFLLVYVVESLFMLTFFIFITGKIRTHNTLTPPTSSISERLPAPHATGGLRQIDAVRA